MLRHRASDHGLNVLVGEAPSGQYKYQPVVRAVFALPSIPKSKPLVQAVVGMKRLVGSAAVVLRLHVYAVRRNGVIHGLAANAVQVQIGGGGEGSRDRTGVRIHIY